MILYSIFFIASVIIHEFGHYLFGKILRFKFDYIVLFGVCIYKENNKLYVQVKPRINAMTSMKPIGIKYLFVRLFFYYLGGIINSIIAYIVFNKIFIKSNYIIYLIELVSIILALIRYLEMGKIGLAKKTFNNLYKLLLNSNYLSDKAEILYFYIFIQPDAIICDLYINKYEKYILESNIYNKYRVLWAIKIYKNHGELMETSFCNQLSISELLIINNSKSMLG